VGAIAVSFFFCHKVRKSFWSSDVNGGTGLPASSNTPVTATLANPVSSHTPSSFP